MKFQSFLLFVSCLVLMTGLTVSWMTCIVHEKISIRKLFWGTTRFFILFCGNLVFTLPETISELERELFPEKLKDDSTDTEHN